MKKITLSPFFIGFLQAIGISLYCFFAALLIRNGDRLFGSRVEPFISIVFILIFFCASALICALLVGAYPVYIYFTDSGENLKKALRIIIWSGVWLLCFLVFFLGILGLA